MVRAFFYGASRRSLMCRASLPFLHPCDVLKPLNRTTGDDSVLVAQPLEPSSPLHLLWRKVHPFLISMPFVGRGDVSAFDPATNATPGDTQFFRKGAGGN